MIERTKCLYACVVVFQGHRVMPATFKRYDQGAHAHTSSIFLYWMTLVPSLYPPLAEHEATIHTVLPLSNVLSLRNIKIKSK